MIRTEPIYPKYTMGAFRFSEIKKFLILKWLFFQEALHLILLAVIWVLCVYMAVSPFLFYETGGQNWISELFDQIVKMPGSP